ncbi:Na+/H+ antiporter subunit E [Thiocystis violacea]|uniref:Na+/H+ antiporter subunit E n=1 Tax=Thiocystis violacea TaxID=13725 RepID=UPI001904C229|nr:Na+/H+ antiporter subunit E [Thiocystis violacea]MBK1723008.1 cation transporter [Thiocystis violacea]
MAIARRLLVFFGVWIILAGWDPVSWVIGLPAVLFASWVYGRLAEDSAAPGFRRMFAFLPFFLRESFRGGADVARRILRPRMRIKPGFQTYRMRLSQPAARVLFLDCISLLPGSLSADRHQDVIHVHLLDASLDVTPELADLERRVAAIFGERLEPHAYV